MNPLSALLGLLLIAGEPARQDAAGQIPQPKASYHYKLLHSNVQIGDASYERISTAADRRTLLTINETVDGDTLNAVFDTTSRPDGTPTKKVFHGLLSQHPFSSTALFTDAGVNWTLQDIKGVTHQALIKPPPNAVIADASEAWFVGVIPKKGDACIFTSFNIQNGKWEQTTTTYVGDEDTKVGKAIVKTHHMHVKSETGEIEMYMDDSADIVVMDQLGVFRMERAD